MTTGTYAERSMRLFTGIDLPPAVRQSLGAVVSRLRPHARLKWQPVENLHITTKFIGEWPENRLEELVDALGELRERPPMEIRVGGLGWFPNDRAPRVLWTGVKAEEGLAELASQTEDSLARLGISREGRPFAPHLTLARVREPVPLDRLKEAIAAMPCLEFGAFVARSFFLYQSVLRPQGSVYTKLEEFVFRS